MKRAAAKFRAEWRLALHMAEVAARPNPCWPAAACCKIQGRRRAWHSVSDSAAYREYRLSNVCWTTDEARSMTHSDEEANDE
jgi:hypothetical protein